MSRLGLYQPQIAVPRYHSGKIHIRTPQNYAVGKMIVSEGQLKTG